VPDPAPVGSDPPDVTAEWFVSEEDAAVAKRLSGKGKESASGANQISAWR